MNPYIKTAIKACQAAGKIIKSSYQKKNLDFSDKSSRNLIDYVTKVDQRAEQVIRRIISGEYPDHAILGEELGLKPGDSKNDFLWIVDPIDGTKNFVRKITWFGVSIGLFKDGKPYAGVLYHPLENKICWAVKNQGAFLGRKRIHLSRASQLKTASVATDLGKTETIRKKTFAAVKKIIGKVPIIHMIGSTTYSVLGLMENQYDALIDNGDIWDFAASIIIIQEAGGQVTTWKGEKVTQQTKYVLWAKKGLHRKMVNLLSDIK